MVKPAFGDPYFEEQLARYHFAIPFAKERNALDVGCGQGFGSCALATAAFEVTAVDSDPSALDFARKQYAHPRIQFVNDQLIGLKAVKKKYDVVTAFETLERVGAGERDEFLRHLAAHVHLQGVALISLKRAGAGGSGASQSRVSAREIKELLLRHFGEVQLLGQIKSRGPLGNWLMRLGLLGPAPAPKSAFGFEPLMYWRPELGWGEAANFLFSVSLWKRADTLVAICRNPKAA